MKLHGIDLHSNTIVVATMDYLNGQLSKIETTKCYLHTEQYEQFLKSLSKEDYILVEASTNTFWFYDQVIARVKDCFVLDVNKEKASEFKTDKRDAAKLTKMLVFHIVLNNGNSNLALVYIPTKEVRDLRSLIKTHTLQKKQTVQLKNRIKSLVRQYGYRCATKSFKKIFEFVSTNTNIPKSCVAQIEILIGQLSAAEKSAENIRNLINQNGNNNFQNEIKLLISIPGFSPLTAITLMSDVVDVNRFKNEKKYCSYLRTAPTIKSSNNTTRIGRVNKKARTATCTALTQSITHFKTASVNHEEFYNRVKVGKSFGKVRVALIRKILVSTYFMLKRKVLFFEVDVKKYSNKLKEFQRELKKGILKEAA